MKQQVRILLTLLVVSFCAMQSAWARVAPTFPTPQTLESGKTYYLYNVGSDRFLYYYASSVNAYPESYSAVTVTNENDDIYNLKLVDSGRYLYSSGREVYTTTSTSGSYLQYRRYHINAADGGYTIQRDYDYNETYFMGNSTGNSSIYTNFTSGNIVWQFFDAEGAEAIIRYRAKKALYDALVAADDYSLSFATAAYEALYEDETATNEQLTDAANTITKGLLYKNMLATGDSDYPIYTELTGTGTWSYDTSKNTYNYTYLLNGECGLKATVNVDQDATLVYSYKLDSNYGFNFSVYLDGQLYQHINNYEGVESAQNYFVKLSEGLHTIEWKAVSTHSSNSSYFKLYSIAAYKTPTITVNLTQAGSLGTEVLYHVDHIKDVRRLVVKGNMNEEDWERLNMMTGLFELDLSGTTVKSLPVVNPSSYLHKVKLPTGLTEIQEKALQNVLIEEITFPNTLTTIGANAFRYTRIKEAILPETVTSVGNYAFASNESLEKVVWPAAAATIPDYCFMYDYLISSFELPEGVTSIGSGAFQKNYKCNYLLPSTLQSIGSYAFNEANSISSLYIPDNCSIGYNAFSNCAGLKYVNIGERCSFSTYSSYYDTFSSCKQLEEIVFPTTFHKISYADMIYGCTALKKVTFKSPTMIDGDKYKSFFNNLGTDIAVYVPSYLVNTYKLDSYWYNYNIMGFSTADVTDWTINNTLTFYSQDRFEGTPNVDVRTVGAWTINGEAPQNINNFTTWYNSGSYSVMNVASKFISNCENVNISGDYSHRYYSYTSTNSSYYGRWHFICLPFDIKVSEITCSDNALFAIRYYDGANRAENGTGGNWKDYATDAVIPAGTGFILQTSKECRVYFNAMDNASKQNVVSNKIFTKALSANDSEQSSNKGWNLVGNPWLCYYNIHKMNFTGPITVYDGYERKYTAYSVIDDDYAILPNQAFFVQCPDNVNSISFPIDGRQMTSVIESQNAAPSLNPTENLRRLVDIELTDGELADKTRLVLNPQAKMDYEVSCDASKFMEADSHVPQIYTIENGVQMAINERPAADGIIKIGMLLPADGTYTIMSKRNALTEAVLVDKQNGTETILSEDGYTFSAQAGTTDNRFELHLSTGDTTGIGSLSANKLQEGAVYYDLNGRRVAEPTKGVYIQNGKKVVIK